MHTCARALTGRQHWDVTRGVKQACVSPGVCVHCCALGCRSLQVHVSVIRLCCRSGCGSNVLIRLACSAKAPTVTLAVWFISMETREKLWSNYPLIVVISAWRGNRVARIRRGEAELKKHRDAETQPSSKIKKGSKHSYDYEYILFENPLCSVRWNPVVTIYLKFSSVLLKVYQWLNASVPEQ